MHNVDFVAKRRRRDILRDNREFLFYLAPLSRKREKERRSVILRALNVLAITHLINLIQIRVPENG